MLCALGAGCNRGPAAHDGASFAVSRDGQTVAWTTGPGAGNSLRIRDASGTIKTLATGAYFEGPTLSPDGKYVLVATGKSFRAKLSLVRIELATGKKTAFAEAKEESHYSPSYSPNGGLVVFRSAARPRSQSMGGVQWLDYDLYVTDPEGKYIERLTEFKSERMTPPRWAPDGRGITIAASDKDGRTWLRIIDPGGRIEWEAEGQNNESMPIFLGKKLVIVSDRANVGRYHLGYLDTDKGGFTPITKQEGYYIDPQVANGKVYVLEDVSHKMRFRISELDLATGETREVVPEAEFDEPKKP